MYRLYLAMVLAVADMLGQLQNLAGSEGAGTLQRELADELVPCTAWEGWLDEQGRVVRHAFGLLSHPESEPDWSLLH